MSQTAIQFSANGIPAYGASRQPVPGGEYKVIVKGGEIEPNKDQTGKVAKMEYQIIEGPLAGQSIYDNINYINKQPIAQRIAQERLSALCRCTGVIELRDLQQLQGIPFVVKVSLRDNKYNDVDSYARVDGVDLAQMAPTMSAAPGAPLQVQQAPAWAQQPAAPQQQAPAPVQQAAPPPQQYQPQPAPQQAPQQFQQPAAPPPQQFQQPAAPQQQAPVQQQPAWQPPAQQQPAPVQQQPAPPPGAPAAAMTPPWMQPKQ